MQGGTLFWGSLLMLAALGAGALATGRWRLEAVVDASDARFGRWMIGVLAIAGAAAAVALEPAPMLVIPAIALGVAGICVIATASRLAPGDRTAGSIARAISQSAAERARAREMPSASPFDIQTAWLVILVGVAFIVGASAMIVLLPIDLASRPHLPVWSVVVISAVAWVFLLSLIMPTAWLIQRRIRGIPVFRIDGRGVVMGTDRERDLHVDWPDITAVDLSVRQGGGIRYHIITFATTGEAPRGPKSPSRMVVLAANRVLYGAPFAISTYGLTASTDEILSQIAVHLPDLRSVPNGHTPGR